MSEVKIFYKSKEEIAFRVLSSKKIEYYVVTKNIPIVGMPCVRFGNKYWSCECPHFMFRTSKINKPCKHIITARYYLSNVEKTDRW